MEYQNIINLLNSTPNQLSKFRTKYWIVINDQSRGVYNVNSNIRFKTTMIKSSFVIIAMHTYLLTLKWLKGGG